MRKVSYIVVFLIFVLSAVSCFKEVAFRTTYVVKPLRQLTSDDRNPAVVPDATAFVCDADTAEWTVASYDDALNGIITSKADPAVKETAPLALSEPYGADGWIRLPLDREWQMVVVVDPLDRLYAYTQQQIGENLPMLTVSVLFQPWKTGSSYKNGNWSFRNDFYVDPSRVDCFVDARVQSVEEGAAEPLESPKIYAYGVDTAQWRIASYEDAVDGVITSKSSGQTRTSPDFPAYAVPDSDLYSMEVTSSPLMLVVVDRTHRMYAYTKAEVDLTGTGPTFSVLFRPWREQWIAVEEGWCFVDDLRAPVPDEENQTLPAR
ncbi:MAG: hypothetical protein NC209_06715 [Alistipes sp.]|nr:hypothetical protein [Alistipes senegalensis]MCM1250817.1 hypothetical protein [Alistipes sp.]